MLLVNLIKKIDLLHPEDESYNVYHVTKNS